MGKPREQILCILNEIMSNRTDRQYQNNSKHYSSVPF